MDSNSPNKDLLFPRSPNLVQKPLFLVRTVLNPSCPVKTSVAEWLRTGTSINLTKVRVGSQVRFPTAPFSYPLDIIHQGLGVGTFFAVDVSLNLTSKGRSSSYSSILEENGSSTRLYLSMYASNICGSWRVVAIW